jgi:hypothetical protein
MTRTNPIPVFFKNKINPDKDKAVHPAKDTITAGEWVPAKLLVWRSREARRVRKNKGKSFKNRDPWRPTPEKIVLVRGRRQTETFLKRSSTLMPSDCQGRLESIKTTPLSAFSEIIFNTWSPAFLLD